MIKSENKQGVHHLRLEHGKVNALDLELCQAFTKTLKDTEHTDARAMVITGAGPSFSAGVDLVRLLQEPPDYTRKFVPALMELLNTLFLFPKPTVVAVNGHAIAGGCVIACASDYKLAAEGEGRIGVPEVLVGVPFPPLAFEIVRFAANHEHLQEIIYFGRYYSMREGKERGLIDEVVPAQSLLDRAHEIAVTMSKIPSETFSLVKRQLREQCLTVAKQSQNRFDEIVHIWSSDKTRATIRDYLQRTIGKEV